MNSGQTAIDLALVLHKHRRYQYERSSERRVWQDSPFARRSKFDGRDLNSYGEALVQTRHQWGVESPRHRQVTVTVKAAEWLT
ncbi:MAG: hypothetical protein R3B96_13970 [Pirellulaceae bacterium]